MSTLFPENAGRIGGISAGRREDDNRKYVIFPGFSPMAPSHIFVLTKSAGGLNWYAMGRNGGLWGRPCFV